MLSCHADTDLEVIWTGLHVSDNWTELNGLGARTEDEEDSSHFCIRDDLVLAKDLIPQFRLSLNDLVVL